MDLKNIITIGNFERGMIKECWATEGQKISNQQNQGSLCFVYMMLVQHSNNKCHI
jgi:hypothetical protein